MALFSERGDVADRQPFRGHAAGIGDDLDLARVAREHFDLADAGDARERRPHHVEPVVVQVGRRQAAGQIERQERKRRRHQAIDEQIEIRRHLGPRLADPVLHLLQRDHHVGGRIELRRDLRGAAKRARAHAADAGHFHDRLLDRPRHGEHHRIGRRHAGVRDDDDARELQRRIDVARQREAGQQSSRRDERGDHHHRPRLPHDQRNGFMTRS